jgi:hypothetical protein
MLLNEAVPRPRRIGGACAVAAAVLAALTVAPLAAAARPDRGSAHAVATAAAGTVYGGATAQQFPVVITASKNGRKVVMAHIAIRLNCTSGATITLPDGYRGLSVSKKRKFSAAFGPETNRNADGTTTDLEGTMSGAFNKARTKVSGKWTYTWTDRDASGAVTDTCASGSVSWKAKQ